MSVAEGAASGRGRADSKQLNDRRHRQFRISGKLASTPPLSLSLSLIVGWVSLLRSCLAWQGMRG